MLTIPWTVLTTQHTYPVSGMRSHCYGNPGVLTDGSFVTDCRCWSFFHRWGFTAGMIRQTLKKNPKTFKSTEFRRKQQLSFWWMSALREVERQLFLSCSSNKNKKNIWNCFWPFCRNQRFKLPLILLGVKHQPVHDLILLLWRDEVLYDQIPGSSEHTERQKFHVTVKSLWFHHLKAGVAET